MIWLLFALAMVAGLALGWGAVVRLASYEDKLVAVQCATIFAVLSLAALSIGLQRASFLDLSLLLAVSSLPGCLLVARVIEGWLS